MARTARRSLWSYRRQMPMVWRFAASGVFFVTGVKVVDTPLSAMSLMLTALGLGAVVALLFIGCAAARRQA